TELLPEGTAEQITSLNEMQHLSTTAENAVRLQQLYNNANVQELATVVRAPTLVPHALHDMGVSFDEGRLIAAHILNARLVPLDSKNHLLLPSEPAWHHFWHEFYGFFGVDYSDDLPDSHHDGNANLQSLFSQLTSREHDILQLLASGLSNQEIAL